MSPEVVVSIKAVMWILFYLFFVCDFNWIMILCVCKIVRYFVWIMFAMYELLEYFIQNVGSNRNEDIAVCHTK